MSGVNHGKAGRGVLLVTATVIVFNLLLCSLRISNSGLDHDEFQHTHIAWQMSRGRLLYRDFFEHHGPVFPFWNSLLVRLFRLEPGFGTILALRYLNIIYIIFTLYLTYKVGVRLSGSQDVGFISAATLSTLLFFQDKAGEIRPDSMQAIFILAGTYVMLDAVSSGRGMLHLYAGLFFGMAFLTNVKAGLAVAAVLLYYVLAYLSRAVDFKAFRSEAAAYLAGVASVSGVFSLYFLFKNALGRFWFYYIYFNLLVVLKPRYRHVSDYYGVFLSQQTAFCLMAAFGVAFIVIRALRDRREWSGNIGALFFLTLTASTAASSAIGLFSQYYLMFLPLLSITAAYGIYGVAGVFRGSLAPYRPALLLVVLVLSLGSLTSKALDTTPFRVEGLLEKQRYVMDYIIGESSVDAPVLYMWDECGGYVFNDGVQYYWAPTGPDYHELYWIVEGYNVYGESMVEALDGRNVRFIVSKEEELRWISEVTHRYMADNYHNIRYDCLWVRND